MAPGTRRWKILEGDRCWTEAEGAAAGAVEPELEVAVLARQAGAVSVSGAVEACCLRGEGGAGRMGAAVQRQGTC